jgi:UDP-N-acetylglucosamine 2-epimerase
MKAMKRAKVMTVVGTRPEIIKLSRVIAELRRHTDHILVHTGQNYDPQLNEIFFKELAIAPPDHYLAAAGETAAETIAQVISKSDALLAKETPDALLLLGDTNSGLCVIPPSGARSRSSTWKPGTAASTSACPRRSTARSSTTPATST